MAIDAAYATVPRYADQIKKSSRADDVVLRSQLIATSRWIDRKLEPLFFYLEEAVSTRIYRPGAAIAPIASTTGLVVKAASGYPIEWDDVDAMTLGTDFELEPANALVGPFPEPYTDLRILGFGLTPAGVWQPKTYIPDDYRVSITAIHGHPGGVPEAIVNATVIFTSMLRGESPYATGAFQSLDQVEQASPQARGFLKELIGIYHPTGITVG